MGNKTTVVKRFHNEQTHEYLADLFANEVIEQLKDIDITGNICSDELFEEIIAPNKEFEGKAFEPKLLNKKIVEKLKNRIEIELNSLIREHDTWTINLDAKRDEDHIVPVPRQYQDEIENCPMGLGIINSMCYDFCLYQEEALKDFTKIQRKRELINSLTPDQLEAVKEFSPDLLNEEEI